MVALLNFEPPESRPAVVMPASEVGRGRRAKPASAGGPSFLSEPEIVREERERDRDERSREYEDFDNRPNYSSDGGDAA